MKKLSILAIVVLLGSLLAFADKKDEPQGASEVKFQVVKADNGKPVRNASVILHPVTKQGWQSKKGFELKTDSEGNTQLAVPYGKVRVQVIAPGFQTYGEDFVLTEPTREIVIKLERPKDQYTIYK
ncbi:carboxypeptidase-like regulatory domain-containing protein [Candidatus Korobacter versatilis]|nr:carboxypeptidase-like regulatory domain-containing protein [Candidatus Koribacter versatilis]